MHLWLQWDLFGADVTSTSYGEASHKILKLAAANTRRTRDRYHADVAIRVYKSESLKYVLTTYGSSTSAPRSLKGEKARKLLKESVDINGGINIFMGIALSAVITADRKLVFDVEVGVTQASRVQNLWIQHFRKLALFDKNLMKNMRDKLGYSNKNAPVKIEFRTELHKYKLEKNDNIDQLSDDELKDLRTIFRAHPYFNGAEWRDFGYLAWENEDSNDFDLVPGRMEMFFSEVTGDNGERGDGIAIVHSMPTEISCMNDDLNELACSKLEDFLTVAFVKVIAGPACVFKKPTTMMDTLHDCKEIQETADTMFVAMRPKSYWITHFYQYSVKHVFVGGRGNHPDDDEISDGPPDSGISDFEISDNEEDDYNPIFSEEEEEDEDYDDDEGGGNGVEEDDGGDDEEERFHGGGEQADDGDESS